MKKTRDDLFKHSKKRACSRWDLELTRSDYEKLCDLIRNNKTDALFLARESNTRTHWLLNGQYIVVYNTLLKAIATFLPADAINNYTKDSDYFKLRKQIQGYTPFDCED